MHDIFKFLKYCDRTQHSLMIWGESNILEAHLTCIHCMAIRYRGNMLTYNVLLQGLCTINSNKKMHQNWMQNKNYRYLPNT